MNVVRDQKREPLFPALGKLRKIDGARAAEILTRLTGDEWVYGLGTFFCCNRGMACGLAADPVPAIRKALLTSGRHVRLIVEYLAEGGRLSGGVKVNTTQWHCGPDEVTAYCMALLAEYPELASQTAGAAS